MKKFIAGLLIALFGVLFISFTMQACGWWWYQPELPSK